MVVLLLVLVNKLRSVRAACRGPQSAREAAQQRGRKCNGKHPMPNDTPLGVNCQFTPQLTRAVFHSTTWVSTTQGAFLPAKPAAGSRLPPLAAGGHPRPTGGGEQQGRSTRSRGPVPVPVFLGHRHDTDTRHQTPGTAAPGTARSTRGRATTDHSAGRRAQGP